MVLRLFFVEYQPESDPLLVLTGDNGGSPP